MSLFEPDHAPIAQRLPQQERSLVRKYEELSPLLAASSIPPEIQHALVQFDAARVSRGQNPLTRRQTAHAAIAATTGQPSTLPRERNPLSPTSFLPNLTRDIRAIASTVPKLLIPSPNNPLIKEVSELADAPEQIAQQLANGENIITALSRAPGIELLPGAFAVGELARGREGVKELARHPLMTALDLLPYAGKAARATKTGQLAAAAGKRPLPAVLTSRAVDGQLQPNAIGRAGQALGRTAPGQLAREAFGQTARQVSRVRNQADLRLSEQVYGKTDEVDPLIIATRQAAGLRSRYSQLDDNRIAELTTLIQTDPARIADLPDLDRAFIQETREINAKLAESYRDAGLVDLIDGEVYSLDDARKIRTVESRFNSRVAAATKLLPRLEKVAGDDPILASVLESARAGDWNSASQALSRVTRRRTKLTTPSRTGAKPGERSDIQLSTISNIRVAFNNAAKAQRGLQRVTEQAVPARFRPLVRRRAEDAYKDVLISRASPEDAAKITQAISERNYASAPGFDEREFARLQSDVEATWRQMKDEGLDPVFVHRVPTEREWQVRHPHAMEVARTPSAAFSRTTDMAPYVQDVTVGLTHQGIELLSRRASEEIIATIVETWGRSERDLIDTYIDAARLRAQQNPRKDVLTHANDLIASEYVRFSPNEFVTWPSTRITGLDPDRVYVPKVVANTLKRMHTPPGGRLSAPFDTAMGLYRTSLLPLSPRWHLYNVFGGGILVGARTGPSVLKFVNTARKMVKEGLGPDELRLLRHTSMRDVAEFNYYSGRTLGRLFRSVQENKLLQRVKSAAGTVIEKSYDLNSFFDDTYRAMAYLYGEDKAIRKGLTRAQSQRAGMEVARRVLQSWDELTPIERSILRYVFPFYSFMQHIMRFAGTFPLDHPVRASILSSFARNELEDLGTGLPETMLNSFFLGDMDEDGNQQAINLRGMNPFSDVANYFTLAGFLGASNPLIATTAEVAGIDTMSGSPELYPTLQYDPETGRLTTTTPGPLSTLIGNLVPQTNVLMGLTQSSSEFKELMRSNPDAAVRMLRSSLGLPVISRRYNLYEEQFKSEVARVESQDVAKNEALKSGNYRVASQYPGLRALVDQVKTLQSSGALRSYERATGLGTTEALKQAVTGTLAP